METLTSFTYDSAHAKSFKNTTSTSSGRTALANSLYPTPSPPPVFPPTATPTWITTTPVRLLLNPPVPASQHNPCTSTLVSTTTPIRLPFWLRRRRYLPNPLGRLRWNKTSPSRRSNSNRATILLLPGPANIRYSMYRPTQAYRQATPTSLISTARTLYCLYMYISTVCMYHYKGKCAGVS